MAKTNIVTICNINHKTWFRYLNPKTSCINTLAKTRRIIMNASNLQKTTINFLQTAGIPNKIAKSVIIEPKANIGMTLTFPLNEDGWADLDIPSEYQYGLEYNRFESEINIPKSNPLYIQFVRQNQAFV